MSPAEKLKVLHFWALFFGALGFLFTSLCCGTEYWLLAAKSCSRSGWKWGYKHEGLFWHCYFVAVSQEYSVWDLWIFFRTLWSFLLIIGVVSVFIGGFVVICAASLTKLCRVGGVLHLCGSLCLLAVVVMYLVWVQVLDTLEQFFLHQKVFRCPSFYLSAQHGPSFLLAPVAVVSCLVAGLLFIVIGRHLQDTELDRRNKNLKLSTPDIDLSYSS